MQAQHGQIIKRSQKTFPALQTHTHRLTHPVLCDTRHFSLAFQKEKGVDVA